MEKLVLTLTEAAEAMSVSVPTMRTVIHQPGFPAFRVGKRWVIPVDAFREWMHKQALARAAY
jgi:excisionase family DNA binding protein